MTIITIESNNNQEIAKILQEIANDLKNAKYDNCSGMSEDGKNYEFMTMKEQSFVGMSKFLYFQENGNQLKLNTDNNQTQEGYYIIYTDGKNTAADGFPTYEDAKEYMKKELKVGGVFEGMAPNELEIHKK